MMLLFFFAKVTANRGRWRIHPPLCLLTYLFLNGDDNGACWNIAFQSSYIRFYSDKTYNMRLS